MDVRYSKKLVNAKESTHSEAKATEQRFAWQKKKWDKEQAKRDKYQGNLLFKLL